jgi:cytochrome d ubiquinol oxidase subunit I
VLTEVGRQPWIVYGLLRTSDANSPSVSTTWLWTSLGVFAVLYGILTMVDIVLLRRYSDPDRDLPGPESPEQPPATAAISY